MKTKRWNGEKKSFNLTQKRNLGRPIYILFPAQIKYFIWLTYSSINKWFDAIYFLHPNRVVCDILWTALLLLFSLVCKSFWILMSTFLLYFVSYWFRGHSFRYQQDRFKICLTERMVLILCKWFCRNEWDTVFASIKAKTFANGIAIH